MMSHDTYHNVVTYIIVKVTSSYDTEKIVEGCRINDVIQHDNNNIMLVL